MEGPVHSEAQVCDEKHSAAAGGTMIKSKRQFIHCCETRFLKFLAGSS
jgi:hypothetical protein